MKFLSSQYTVRFYKIEWKNSLSWHPHCLGKKVRLKQQLTEKAQTQAFI